MSLQNQSSSSDQQVAANSILPDWSKRSAKDSWGETRPSAQGFRSEDLNWSSQSPDANGQKVEVSGPNYDTQFPQLGKSQVAQTVGNWHQHSHASTQKGPQWGNKLSDQTASDQSKGGVTTSLSQCIPWDGQEPTGGHHQTSPNVDRSPGASCNDRDRRQDETFRGHGPGRWRGRSARDSSFRGRGKALGGGHSHQTRPFSNKDDKPSDAAHASDSTRGPAKVTLPAQPAEETQPPTIHQDKTATATRSAVKNALKPADPTEEAKGNSREPGAEHENGNQQDLVNKQQFQQALVSDNVLSRQIEIQSQQPLADNVKKETEKFASPTPAVNTNRDRAEIQAQPSFNDNNWEVADQLAYGKAHSNVPSNQADGGWGNNGCWDPENTEGHQLQDWSGSWAPPPIDWEGRAGFSNKDLRKHVGEWCSTETAPASLPNGILVLQGQIVTGEIAPRGWVPENVDGQPIDEWWKNRSNEPDPEWALSQEPFWRHYASPEIDILEPLSVLEAKINPAENDLDQILGQTSQTSSNATMTKLQNMQNRRKARKECLWRLHAEAQELKTNEYSPQANVYLRPVEARDMQQITEIYNYYIRNTTCCPEGEPLTIESIQERCEDAVDRKLPFLVAVDRSSKSNRKNNKRFGDRANTQGELVVGFSYADDFNDNHGMYRYTVELDTFVQPARLRQGVGRTLVDKMMSILDLKYEPRGGYEFKCSDPSFGIGGSRTVGNIVINIPYASDDKFRFEWLQSWLKQWEFEKVGEMSSIGRKNGKM